MEYIEAALAESGAAVLARADPTTAPFEMMIRATRGEQLELVCYAFTANKYRQQGRPADEHRFQIKYGSDFNRYHTLYLDRTGRKITLMFGALGIGTVCRRRSKNAQSDLVFQFR